MEAYDTKQQVLAGRTLLLSALGVFLIDANFLHFIDLANSWAAIIAVPLFVLPWIFYFWQWRRNADDFSPSNSDIDLPHPTDEKLREAWELEYIVRRASHHD